MKLRSILSALMLTAGIAAAPTANAAIIMSLQEVGSDVIGTATGSADITGFALSFLGYEVPQVFPGVGLILFSSSTAGASTDVYVDVVAGPTNIGNAGVTLADLASGSPVAVDGSIHALVLPQGYLSGSALSATMTFSSNTLAGLGLNTGVYTWTWGSGDHADSLTLYIGVPVPSAVPVPASLLLLATGVAAVASTRRRKSR